MVDHLVDVPMGTFGNPSVEDVDHALRELNELMECWNHRLTFDNLRLAEHYIKGQLDIMITCRIRDGENFRAVFHKHDLNASHDLSHRHEVETGPYGDDRRVFIGIVQLANRDKTLIPSLVGLEAPDDHTDFGTGTLYFSDECGFKILKRSPYRKFAFAAEDIASRVRPLLGDNLIGFASPVDESRLEIMEVAFGPFDLPHRLTEEGEF